MNEPLSEELLSAYLDGELTREERARVEDWLTASAEHRRLLDDLKAIRRELQALPAQSLDAGFSDRVLAAIRQRAGDTNASPPAATGSSPVADAAEAIPTKPVNLPNRHLGMPAWRWFAAGVAATLLAVIAGMNAAPETMVAVGKLAMVWQEEESPAEPVNGPIRDRSSPATATPLLREETRQSGDPALPADAPTPAAARDAIEATQLDGATGAGATSRAFSGPANKDLAERPLDRGQFRKEATPAQQVQPQAEGRPASTPADAAPDAAAELEAFNENNDEHRALENEAKKPSAGGFENGSAATYYADVVELPVTVEQADRALALYAQTATRQAVRRFSAVENFAAVSTDEYAAERTSPKQQQELALQRSAPAMSLMKLMDAAGSGIEIAAVEVSGSEAEVHALLDTLGVDGRDLLVNRESLGGSGIGGGAGGIGLRANGEGEEAAPKAAALDGRDEKAADKADAAKEKAEESEGGKGGAGPTVRGDTRRDITARAKFGGGSTTSKSRGSKQVETEPEAEKQQAVQSQLRVRLVFRGPTADPIGPTIEIKPQE